jgi:hypothetical protein
MTTAGLLGKLFNLSQYTDALNSPHAALDFWIAAGAVICLAVTLAALLGARHHASRLR